MRLLERIEDRLHFLAIPGLFKWLTLMGVIVFAAQWANPAVGQNIAFDLGLVLKGEVWRIFSFVFAPAGVFPFSPLGVIFLFFATMIAFLISDSLEGEWGATRVTLYIIIGWAGMLVGQILLALLSRTGGGAAGGLLYTSMFLAFATYFPRYEFRLFFILPIQVRWLAWLAFGLLIFNVLTVPLLALVVIPALLPYAIFVLPAFAGAKQREAQAAARRRKFAASKGPEKEAFHRCVVCGRTELSDPDLDFRTMLDGTEYCVDHLPGDG